MIPVYLILVALLILIVGLFMEISRQVPKGVRSESHVDSQDASAVAEKARQRSIRAAPDGSGKTHYQLASRKEEAKYDEEERKHYVFDEWDIENSDRNAIPNLGARSLSKHGFPNGSDTSNLFRSDYKKDREYLETSNGLREGAVGREEAYQWHESEEGEEEQKTGDIEI